MHIGYYLKEVGTGNMNISTEQLKTLLEQAHSDGYDAGARNERSSLHEATGYCEERDKSVSALINTVKEGE